MIHNNSLQQRIYDYIRNSYPRPVGTKEIEMRCLEAGYTGRNGIRRVNELAKEGKIKRLEGKFAQWTI